MLRFNSSGESSFYGSPPQLFFNETAGFETSSRLCLLKYGALCHADVIARWSFVSKKINGDVRFRVFSLVPSSHETSVE